MFAPTEPDLFTTTSPPLFELLCSYVTDDQAHVLHVDFEGRCTRNIKIIGGDNWCQHAEALCLAWAVDGHPVELWWPGDPVPLAFIEAAKNNPQIHEKVFQRFRRLRNRRLDGRNGG